MPIYFPDILQESSEPQSFTYSEKDVILYALGIGIGSDPLDSNELPFVYEKNLLVVPTAATVLHNSIGHLVPRGKSAGHRPSRINHAMVLHAGERTELHRPLPANGKFTIVTRTVDAIDKGKEKGAIIVNETTWTDAAGEKVVTLTSSLFARGDGGFGGPSISEPRIIADRIPDRPPDKVAEFATRPDQAVLYRLSGDLNPLHVDPEVAKRAGFERPILHGLCTYGITCRAVLQQMLAFDSERILSHQVRFSAPVLPGDTLKVNLWREGGIVLFEAHAKERGTVVIKNGKTVLR